MMLFIIFIETLLILLLKGADGQEIVFDQLKLITPCTQGLRNGTDKFTFTGTVGRNYSALVSSGWFQLITLQISVHKSQFTKMCEILIGPDGTVLCGPSSTETCYCDYINTTTGSAHFAVNYPAQEDYSNGIIRAEWQKNNSPPLYSSVNITLPAMYDVTKAKLNLKVNDEPEKPLSATFGVYFLSNKNNTLELCCYESASPCYPRMSLNGTVVESQTGNCVSHTVFVSNVSYTANLTTSYAVCNNIDYIPAGSGMITVENESSTTTETTSEAPPNTAGTTEITTLLPSTSSTTTPGTTEVTTFKPSNSSTTITAPTVKPKDDIVLIVCLGVIIPIVVVAIIIIAIVCYYKNRPEPSQRNIIAIVCCSNYRPRPSKTGTDEAATQDQTGRELNQESKNELKQETRQESKKDSEQNNQVTGGYTNNGFDERRTSPSSIALESRQDSFQYNNTAEEKNGSSKHLTGKTKDRGASKEVPGKPRELPALRGTHGGGQPPGKSRPPSVEVTSYAVKYNK